MTSCSLKCFPQNIQDLCRLPKPTEPIEAVLDYRGRFSLPECYVQYLLNIISGISRGEIDCPKEFSYAGIHSCRALMQFALPDFELRLLPILNEIEWDYEKEVRKEMPFVIAHVAGDRVSELVEAFRDEKSRDDTRIILAEALVRIQEKHPEYRDLVIRTLSDEVSKFAIGRRRFYNHLVACLVRMKAEVTELIEEAFVRQCLDMAYGGDNWEEIHRRYRPEMTIIPDRQEVAASFVRINKIIENMELEGAALKQAVCEARQYRELIVSSLIETLRDAISRLRFGLELYNDTYLIATLLFAEFQAKEAAPYIMEGFALADSDDEDDWDKDFQLFGEPMFQLMPAVLHRILDDDIEQRNDMILDRTRTWKYRSCLARSLFFFVKNGQLTRKGLVDLFRGHLLQAVEHDDDEIATPHVGDLLDCADASAMPDIEAAIAKNLVNLDVTSREEINECMSKGETLFKERLEIHTELDYSDALVALEKWGWLKEPVDENAQKPETKPIVKMPGRPPALSPLAERYSPPPTPSKKVGRNDPCPCGSGKKYKKCCMR